MTLIVGLDPGNQVSGLVLFDGTEVLESGVFTNDAVRKQFTGAESYWGRVDLLAYEYFAPRGMPTSQHEMDTMFELGRMVQCWPWISEPVQRGKVKVHICGRMSAKDSNVRQALIDRFGGQAAIGAIKCQNCKGSRTIRRAGTRGRKQYPDERLRCPACGGSGWAVEPGPLFGVKSHAWSALAVAVYAWDERGW